jgi:hypothetical protein
MTNTKTVFEKCGIKIVREQSYGFRCNTLSSTWVVYKGDKYEGSFIRLKYAKAWVELMQQFAA